MVLDPIAVLSIASNQTIYTPADIETKHTTTSRLAAKSLHWYDWQDSTPVEWCPPGVVYEARVGDINAYVHEHGVNHVTVFDADRVPDRILSNPTTQPSES